MGCDIHGFVEVQKGESLWDPVIHIPGLIHRSYDLFYSLFGVWHENGLTPLFPERGLPPDCSFKIKEETEEWTDCFGHTWAAYEEIKNINWDEIASKRDERIWKFKVINGKEHPMSSSPLNKFPDEVTERLKREERVVMGEDIYRFRTLTRRQSVEDSHFMFLVKLMDVLAEEFGKANVRMVVYFDC